MDLIPQAKRAFHLQSYAPALVIDGVGLVELKRFSDDGGSLTELVRLVVRETSPTKNARMRLVLGAGASRLLRIPPGVAHGVRNVAGVTGRIIYFTDLHFSADPAACDE